MKKKVILLLVVLIPGLWLLLRVWQKVNDRRTTVIGWNSENSFPKDSLNQLGFRGKTIQARKDTSEKIILFIGDSQVEANGLPFNYMIENLVQKLLQQKDPAHTYKCYSVGSGGFGQDQEFLAMKEYFKKYQADEVVLWFTPENDVWNNIFPTHWPMNANPKPTYWIENGSIKGPNYQWMEVYPNPNKSRWRQSLFALKNLDTKWEAKLPTAYQPVPVAAFKGPLSPSPLGDEPIKFEKSHYAVFLTPRSPRMNYGIQLTRFLLDSIQQVCRANHAQFAVFAALNNEVEAMPDSSFNAEQNGQVYTLSKKMFFDNINAIMRGYDFHFFHLDTEWKQISRQDNHHFNHVAQTEIAQKIVDRILLP